MERGFQVFMLIILIVVAAMFMAPVQTECGNGLVEGAFPDPGFEECDDNNTIGGDGCSSSCLLEFPEKIYVAPYMGNIDGHFTEDWFFFYDQLTDYFNKEEIPIGATLYPATLDNPDFHPYIKRMYESPFVEIVQKAYTGEEREQRIDELPYEEQKQIIQKGRSYYVKQMAKIMGIPEDQVRHPLAYNSPQGRFTNVTRRALEDLEFRLFFEMYMNDEIGPVAPTDMFDVVQYGVGITTTGDAGPHTDFFQPRDTLLEIRELDREDLFMVRINCSRVIPLWLHHQDFESKIFPNTVDQAKWASYLYVMNRIKQEPNLFLISPYEIWRLRH
jgi:cysteine-rich repeat protein